MQKTWTRTRTFRGVALTLSCLQVTLGLPLPTLAAESPASAAPKTVVANRTVPQVQPPSRLPVFSPAPSTEEIFRARVFPEPLVPVGGEPSSPENSMLAQALMAYAAGGDAEKLGPIFGFLQQQTFTRWRPALLLNIGVVFRDTGYFSRSVLFLQEAWDRLKNEESPRGKALADRAFAELARTLARLGRKDALAAHLESAAGRELLGSSAELVTHARSALEIMRHSPEQAFRCGPRAVESVLGLGESLELRRSPPPESRSGEQGTSLAQLQALAGRLGRSMVVAQRLQRAPVPLPAVVHWKAGHFAAVLERGSSGYRIDDAVLNGEAWISDSAFEEESSGYFLLPNAGGPGWRAVDTTEARAIWGRGSPGEWGLDDQGPGNPGCGGRECGGGGVGMATYSFNPMLANLMVSDTPLPSNSARGPAVQCTVTYNHREAWQPSSFYYSNFGRQWTFDWLSYIEDNPAQPSATVMLYRRGGGREQYGFDTATGQFKPGARTLARLERQTTHRYVRSLSDGGSEVFSAPAQAVGTARRVFLTRVVDPQGQFIDLTYDASLRVVAVTDAIGLVTTLSYGIVSDPYKITRVTDPYGRFASFEYDPSGRLSRITDAIGLTSEFSYGGSTDNMRSFRTPYGITTFVYGTETGLAKISHYLEATDPLGGKERVQTYLGHHPTVHPPTVDPATMPAGLESRNHHLDSAFSLYWDKRAMVAGPLTAATAQITHWLWSSGAGAKVTGIKRAEKKALESRVWYAYPQQPGDLVASSHTSPSHVARVLDDGTTQAYRYEYNSKGRTTRATDPLGRETVYTYDANEIDLVSVKQKNGSTYDLLQSYAYKQTDLTCATWPTHVPCKVKDAAGQETKYSYNANGKLSSLETPPRSGHQPGEPTPRALTQAERTTTYSYFDDNAALGAGRLQTVTGPSVPAGSPTTSLTYDGYGRQQTSTTDSYTVTYDYDALDRITKTTYPDATFEETVYNRLDPERRRDRLGRWSHSLHDALGRAVSRRDADGSTVTQQWCTCGSLDKLIDANGNATAWQRDVQGRVTRETRADSSYSDFAYENTTSRLKQVTDPKGQVKSLQYASDGRLKQVTYTNSEYSTANVTFTYDSAYPRPLTMQDGTGTTSYGYGAVAVPPALGASRLATVDGPLSSDTIVVTYDELGRVSATSINGTAVSVAFDALGRIREASNALGSFSYTYDGVSNRQASVAYPNGQQTTYGYFSGTAARMLQEIHNKRSGGTTLSKFQYTYSAADRVKTWSQQIDSAAAKVLAVEYNAVDELIAATLTDATPAVVKRYAYAYDPAGNRIAEQIDDGATQATFNSSDELVSQSPGGALRFAGSTSEAAAVTVQGKPATNTTDNKFSGSAQVGSGNTTVAVTATDPAGNVQSKSYQVSQSGSTKTITYDANGNVTGDSSRTFEWDAENRLLAVNVGTKRSEFAYDGVGRRVRTIEKDGGVVTKDTRFLWLGFNVAEERDAAGSTVLKRFFAHGWTDGSTSYFATRDHLGSIRELMDSTGTLRARYEYDPFGRMTKVGGDYDTSVGFSGHYYHATSTLILPRYRAYHADLGRWTSLDPLGFMDGANRYAYVRNDPVSRVDPDGLYTNLFEPPSPTGPIGGFGNCVMTFTLAGGMAGGGMGAGGGTLVLPGVGTIGGAIGLGGAGLIAGAIIGVVACNIPAVISKCPPKVRTSPPENLDDRAKRCQAYRNDVFISCMEFEFEPTRAQCEWVAEMEYLKCMGYPVKPPTTMN